MNNWQEQATNFAQKHNLSHAPGVYALDLMSELGEVAKELLLATAYGQQEPDYDHEAIAGELGDVLYSLCLLATAVDVNLDSAFTDTLQKYEQRHQNKDHIGSTP
jgi:NTP pyrophosphatase (non-canonical NTP hydrolase)